MKVNVTRQSIQLRHHEPRAFGLARLDGLGERGPRVVLAALVLLELADKLPRAAVEVTVHERTLRVDAQALPGRGGSVVRYIIAKRHVRSSR
jgi:hypothetical protein